MLLSEENKQNIFKKIQDSISSNEIVLFLKGSKEMPMCGFSSVVVNILQNLNLDFQDHDVLQSDLLRQGIKEFSNWPTIPQLYIKGEFIGGCDIVKEMHSNGDLLSLLKKHNIK